MKHVPNLHKLTIEQVDDILTDPSNDTDSFNDIDYFGVEDADVKRLFDLDKMLSFTRKHNVQIIRGEDWQFMCFIDGKCHGTGLTTLGAMVYGIANYEKR